MICILFLLIDSKDTYMFLYCADTVKPINLYFENLYCTNLFSHQRKNILCVPECLIYFEIYHYYIQ